MPTAVMTSTWNNTTDADFRQWGKAISDGIAAVGLIKIADTGTVNWATVAKPSTANSGTAWEIWRLNDALQATHPLFIKIEYGALFLTAPGIWITLGRGSNGAGAITGILAPRRLATYEGTPATAGDPNNTIEPIYISSDGSSLAIVARVSSSATTSHNPAVIIDRSRDASGTATASGGVILTEGGGAINLTTPAPASMHSWTYNGDFTMGDVSACAPANVNSSTPITGITSLAIADKAPVFPYIAVVPNHDPWQVLAAVGVMAGDAANGPFTANVLGQVRTYRSIPVSNAHNRWMAGNAAGYTGLCILWPES